MGRFHFFILPILLLGLYIHSKTYNPIKDNTYIRNNISRKMDTATFGAGCFWCVEAVFRELRGVESVCPGYAGGTAKNPSYKEVCSGKTGHAEVCQIIFDPSIIKYDDLLEIFWQTHDPTTKDRQGNDIGTQYRSVIFCHNLSQQLTAESYKKKINESGAFNSPVITEILPITTYYAAEDYHKDYYKKNPDQPYCTYVILPKLEKLHKVFSSKLK